MSPVRIPAFVFAALCLTVVSSAHAGNPVRPPASAMVYLPVEACATPDGARFSAAMAAGTEGWRLAGAPVGTLAVSLDAERAAALGVPTNAIRAALVAAAGADDVAGLLVRQFETKAGAKVPAGAFLSAAEAPRSLERVTLDGRPVVAALADAPASVMGVAQAGAALASVCSVPVEKLKAARFVAEAVEWRISYRTEIPDAEARWARARGLEGAIGAHRGRGRTVGFHREKGGAIYGLLASAGSPSLPTAAAMGVPGLRVLVQGIEGKAWSRPVQAVVRVFGPADQAAAVLTAAESLARAAGGDVGVVLGSWERRLVFVPDTARLAGTGVAQEDVEFMLNGGGFATASGKQIAVTVTSTPDALSRLRVVAADGRSVPIAELGTVELTRAPVTAQGKDGRAQVYLAVPSPSVMPTAMAIANAKLPKGVSTTQHNWKVLKSDESGRFLDWWQGK